MKGILHVLTILAISTEILASATPSSLLPLEHAKAADLPRDPKGFRHMGRDGVLRAFNGDGDVTGYVRLDPAKIKEHVSKFKDNDRLKASLTGIDGRDVADLKQLTKPPAHLLPKKHGMFGNLDGTDILAKPKKRGTDLKKCYSNTCNVSSDCYTYDVGCTICGFNSGGVGQCAYSTG